jgi:hypothetical protein
LSKQPQKAVPKKLGQTRSFNKASLQLKGKILTNSYGIYIWQPPLSQSSKGLWKEPLQANTLEFALSVANLIHNDSRAEIKVVHNGLTLACFPDENTVQLVEQQIARQPEEQ